MREFSTWPRPFFENPDHSLQVGFRRLEDVIRDRATSKEFGVKLFNQAFLGDESRLHWPEVLGGEQAGRAQMFSGAFATYRNPRAHREAIGTESLVEFLALNQLFLLEASAEERPPSAQPTSTP